jgi:erythrocyte band 7 integral membrane protein
MEIYSPTQNDEKSPKSPRGETDETNLLIVDHYSNLPSDHVRHTSLTAGETIVFLLATLVYILLSPILIWFSFKTIDQYSKAVRFRMGKANNDIFSPGLVWVNPFTDKLYTKSMRTNSLNVPKQRMISKDSVSVDVDAVIFYRVNDVLKATLNVEDDTESVMLLAQSALRTVVGHHELQDLVSKRDNISKSMQKQLEHATHQWGITVDRVEIKDLILPREMQRAMAAEAEATREAKAKLVAATGELNAAKNLQKAAEQMSKDPVSLQLRYLQTLTTIAAEHNSTIIFPFPIDIMPPGTKPALGSGDTGNSTILQAAANHLARTVTQ